MRTLHVRILVTFTFALLCTAVAMLWLSDSIVRQSAGKYFEGSMQLHLKQARRAYESGGPAVLSAYLRELDATLNGERHLTDAGGRDVATGQDLSHLKSARLRKPFKFGPPPRGQLVISLPSEDGRYFFITIAPPPISPLSLMPYFLIALLLLASLGIWLSVGIVSPLHKLAKIMDSFGRGDRESRADERRQDEIGKLAKSFNTMAERIGTLLTAERRLLQDVSHELRSPLARLSFAAELMKNARDPEAALSRVKREITRLSGLVGTLLEMTSAEGDPTSRKVVPVQIAPLVQEVVDDCTFEAAGHNVSVEYSAASQAIIDGDPELLRRAVENILRNAIRYSTVGSRIDIRLGDEPEGIALQVRDYGPGVPAAKLDRIFDAFYRVEESRDSSEGGVGLGLSIVRRVVLLHRGTVEAENASPGLLVRIFLPVNAG